MGHERIALPPKSQRWTSLADQICGFYSADFPVDEIAAHTLENVRTRYERLCKDDAVKAVFSYMIKLARASGTDDPQKALHNSGISFAGNPSLISLVNSLKSQVPHDAVASEYGQLAIAAASDALGGWYRDHSAQQLDLFKSPDPFFGKWQALANGSGFCELSRLFFGKLTERYLNYFLERSASAACPSLEHRELFRQGIRHYLSDVSLHAFESAKITQSFAAGWYNKHAIKQEPSEKEVEGFLSVAFGKMREELRREGEPA
jgi:hypothetical protein